MRALMFVGLNELRFDEVPDPQLVDPTDALVRPIAATTCDLDHHVIDGRTPFTAFGPFALGHECVGVVTAVGPDCTNFSVGDKVGVAWHVACGTCAQCLVGHPARCERYWNSQYGLPVRGEWGGTFSELIRVPFADFNLARLPDNVDPIHLASIGDNLALGYESVIPSVTGIVEPTVGIFGGTGSIGLYCVDAAVSIAGAQTTYHDTDPVRLDVAESLGAEVSDEIPEQGFGDRYDLAVDASADPHRLRSALRSVVPEGKVNSVGIYFDEVRIPMLDLYLRGVDFHNGKGHARPNMGPTLGAVAAGTLRPELVTSGIYDWDLIPEVLTSGDAGHKPIFTLSAEGEPTH